MSLTDAQYELFDQLTDRTFYVIDTEYTPAPDGQVGNRLISIAVIPVTGGSRVAAADELYLEMNPGVPIRRAAGAKNGFTDASVARKRPFAFYAQRIIDAFTDVDGIVVEHTAVDVALIIDELQRLADATGQPWPDRLPDLPVIDSSTLPRLLHLPGVGRRGTVSLATLNQLTRTTNSKPHHARHDARATADALLELLRHAARTGRYLTVEDLLADHAQGSTRNPRGPRYIRSRRGYDPDLPAEHVAKHGAPLTHPAAPEELDDWVERARECVTLHCQWLADEASVARDSNGDQLARRLLELLPAATEPGHAGTLAGALHELIARGPDGEPGALPARSMLRWWASVRGPLASAAACQADVSRACPSCRSG